MGTAVNNINVEEDKRHQLTFTKGKKRIVEDKMQRWGWTKKPKKDGKVQSISQVLGCCDVSYEKARKEERKREAR